MKFQKGHIPKHKGIHKYRIYRNCKVCNKEFYFDKSQLKHRNPQYCSRKCFSTIPRKGKSRYGKDNPFYNKKHTELSKLKMKTTRLDGLRSGKIKITTKGKKLNPIYKKCLFCGKIMILAQHRKDAKYCNKECAKKGYNPINHWNWNGGVSSETKKRIGTYSWNITRKKVYARDNWTCQVCGKHCSNDIQCHHIVPYRITQDNSESNLITLCKSCHLKEEKKYYKIKNKQLDLELKYA
jgi:hypothetical protein